MLFLKVWRNIAKSGNIVREKLAVLRPAAPEREVEIVEEARTTHSYDWRLLYRDFLSFGLCK